MPDSPLLGVVLLLGLRVVLAVVLANSVGFDREVTVRRYTEHRREGVLVS